jgi:hypothetical protein
MPIALGYYFYVGDTDAKIAEIIEKARAAASSEFDEEKPGGGDNGVGDVHGVNAATNANSSTLDIESTKKEKKENKQTKQKDIADNRDADDEAIDGKATESTPLLG